MTFVAVNSSGYREYVPFFCEGKSGHTAGIIGIVIQNIQNDKHRIISFLRLRVHCEEFIFIYNKKKKKEKRQSSFLCILFLFDQFKSTTTNYIRQYCFNFTRFVEQIILNLNLGVQQLMLYYEFLVRLL